MTDLLAWATANSSTIATEAEGDRENSSEELRNREPLVGLMI